ncbi:MAG: Fic family protein [Pseudomonadota bacterium]
MEPTLPNENDASLNDLAVFVLEKGGTLSARIHPIVATEVAELVRSMNCYYSNLIEGHDTHPREIERALREQYSDQPKKRVLQLEAKAHIEVQRIIDRGEFTAPMVSAGFIAWIHEQFCARLPEEMLWVENPDTRERVRVVPGEFRKRHVQVGRHIPPVADDIAPLLERFAEVYAHHRLSRSRQIAAAAASHHRLLWIHPFLDGNGRVARLFSHAYLKQIGLGCNGLWSISRGLARNVEEYKSRLMDADHPRLNDLDGRGNLSERGLRDFCEFFFRICADQIDFMSALLDPMALKNRIELFAREGIAEGRLPKGSDAVLVHVLLFGEMPRGKVAAVTGYKERQGRTVLHRLIREELLVSETSKGPVRLGFPIDVVERWFPKLYPV